MRHVFAGMFCLALAGTGCDSGPGYDTPEAAAKAMAEGFTKKDAKAAERMLPPEDKLKAHFDCPDDKLVKGRQKRLERWPEELAKAPAGMTMEIGAINAEESKTETLAKDADYEGCKVKEPVTIRALRLTLKITVDGKVDDDGETMRFVKFGDKERWYYFKL